MSNMTIQNSWYNALKMGYFNYLVHGARSNQKLIPIHSWIRKELISKLGKNFSVISVDGEGAREFVVEGRYYPKREDVVILRDGKPIYVISFKFVTSNYQQNMNNYFENLIGECANIRSTGVAFAHIIVLRDRTPYFKKNQTIEKFESISKENLIKYGLLAADGANGIHHAPNLLLLEIININPVLEENGFIPGKVSVDGMNDSGPIDLNTSNGRLEKSGALNVLGLFDIEYFISSVVNYCKKLE